MVFHVAVDPHPLVLLLSLHHLLVFQVVLVVAPDDVVDGGGVQNLHHALPFVKGGQQVRSQKVTGQHAAKEISTSDASEPAF